MRVIVCADLEKINSGGARNLSYTKAGDILPDELIEQIQQYISGELIYIPKRAGEKAVWGEHTSTRAELEKRNAEIYKKFLNGVPVPKLAAEYFLVDKSIQRIIRQEKNKK